MLLNYLRGGELKKLTLSQIVFKTMKALPIGQEFYGREFQKLVGNDYPSAVQKYTDTILRIARASCRDMFICINRHTSLYKRVKTIDE